MCLAANSTLIWEGGNVQEAPLLELPAECRQRGLAMEAQPSAGMASLSTCSSDMNSTTLYVPSRAQLVVKPAPGRGRGGASHQPSGVANQCMPGTAARRRHSAPTVVEGEGAVVAQRLDKRICYSPINARRGACGSGKQRRSNSGAALARACAREQIWRRRGQQGSRAALVQRQQQQPRCSGRS